MKRKPQFDVVVDGLNVANINKDKGKLSETVGSAWQRSHRFDGRILVLWICKKKKKNANLIENVCVFVCVSVACSGV